MVEPVFIIVVIMHMNVILGGVMNLNHCMLMLVMLVMLMMLVRMVMMMVVMVCPE